jgi:hypothetical protein
MADASLRINRKQWDRFERAIDPKLFRSKFKSRKLSALDRVARVIVREAIAAGGFEKNADLTTMIKGSARPLRDSGKQLSRAIKTRRDGDKVFVGVPFNSPFYEKARAIHDGATLKVTPKMREMFILLWLASNGEISEDQLTGRAAELYQRKSSGWLPLKSSTRIIKIPARPFMDAAFGAESARAEMRSVMARAVNETLAEMAR